MKNVQIPYELFVDLVLYHLNGEDDFDEDIRRGLEQKLDAMLNRQLYSQYKTASTEEQREQARHEYLDRRGVPQSYRWCALPGFVDSKNEEKTERNAGYLVVSHSGGGMLRQGTRKGIRRTPANRGMRAHRIVKSLDISEDVCHGLCP